MSLETPGSDPIVLDLGTGLRFFGESMGAGAPFRGTAFVTHLHWDHVQGLPFFVPINRAGAALDIYAPPQEGCSVADMFGEFMRPPYFPVRTSDLFGEVRFHDAANTDITVGDAVVRVRDVPHVGATNGYRVEMDGLVVAYLSDHQQPVDGSGRIADSVLELCEGADLLIHDAQFTDHEFSMKSNWGHCTVDYAVAVAATAGARRLVLFHHDPGRHDDALDTLTQHAKMRAAALGVPEVIAAAEGTSIVLTKAAIHVPA